MPDILVKDHPTHARDVKNTVVKYCAIWPKTVMKDGKETQKNVGSGWRDDYEDTAALALRMGGYVMRGYFPAEES